MLKVLKARATRGQTNLNNSGNIIIILGGIIVAILQLIVAPFLNLFGATPNFIFAYMLAISVVLTDRVHLISAFTLGALYDFSQGSTLGAWMLLLVVTVLLIQGFSQNLDGNITATLILGIVFSIIVNVLHMLIVVVTTPSISMSALISSGVLWSFLLDSVSFVVFFGILHVVCARFIKTTTFGGYI